jgi:hypothetical protein
MVTLVVATPAVATAAQAVTIDWVTVGDAGNAPDTTGYGAVAYVYGIGKYEFTNTQYTQFLNAVDPQGTNPFGIWNGFMGTDARGGIGFAAGNADGSKYVVRPDMGPKPVNFVNCWGAARVANLLQAGGKTYATTAAGATAIDGGAYTLNGQTSGNVPSKNATAAYWIPLENEWYKAAFYKGGGTNAGYWLFATQSNAVPYAVSATSHGVGTSDGTNPVTSGNYAKWARNAA